ncbi:hypothetical protein VTJ49DRAFT_7204 [Mycothermus thermophilus]|uniref:Uncharacterized protein n=1 Tax=Humicola insolens TaxID=85995 RepID=A0ABR3VQA9_HUMIN
MGVSLLHEAEDTLRCGKRACSSIKTQSEDDSSAEGPSNQNDAVPCSAPLLAWSSGHSTRGNFQEPVVSICPGPTPRRHSAAAVTFLGNNRSRLILPPALDNQAQPRVPFPLLYFSPKNGSISPFLPQPLTDSNAFSRFVRSFRDLASQFTLLDSIIERHPSFDSQELPSIVADSIIPLPKPKANNAHWASAAAGYTRPTVFPAIIRLDINDDIYHFG